MKNIRKIICIDAEHCNGCGNCVIACAEGAIKIIDGKARVIGDKYCDGLGACIGDCPENALKIIEREAEEFDEKAVEELLANRHESHQQDNAHNCDCGCASKDVKIFNTLEAADKCKCAENPIFLPQKGKSALGHWPVKIKLVPIGAPFLKNADLLIAADCVPVACPDFHTNLMKGKAVMTGCPKFDNKEEYIEKFAQIFKESGIKSITITIMDVTCCSALPVIVKKALAAAGKNIPVKEVVVSAHGEIVN
jgi:NAD-dependent dihydropyrimidine dehydrogenase PreA subunit